MSTNKKSRLGRGLSSIFNIKQDENLSNQNIIQNININLIQTNPFQPRTHIAKKN